MCFSRPLIYLNTECIAASKRDQLYSEWFLLAMLDFFFPNPGMEPTCLMSSELAGRFFTIRTTWEAQDTQVVDHVIQGLDILGIILCPSKLNKGIVGLSHFSVGLCTDCY